jgi:Ca2+:H+ antiporter
MKKLHIDIFHLGSFAALLLLAALMAVNIPSFLGVTAAGLFLAVAVVTAIHHAETIAIKVGPALGTLILAVAVTVIEAGLVLVMMANESPNSAVVARDTVFSAVIIVTNGIIGFCFLLGGLKQKELEFKVEGTNDLLAVLATLVGITLILPNFTTTVPGPAYSHSQLIFVSIAALIVYASLVVAQTVTHKEYFSTVSRGEVMDLAPPPTNHAAIMSAVALVLSLVAVVGLAKFLSPSIEAGLESVGAPKSAVGIVIALLVLLPEAGAALTAARTNQLQTSLNLALGSGAASVALTIPVVAVYSIMTGQQISLGLDSKGIAFALITFMVSGLTHGTGKSTFLKGMVHLVILLSYVVLSFVP